MLPNREGLFHAYPAEIGVDETGPNHLTTAIVRFRLFEELKDGQWSDCFDEGLEIVGYFYLECRDGSLNSITLDSLKNALGWDGRDPFWLQETDLSERPVQVKLGFEQYNDKTRLKVQYLNPYGSTGGGISKADDTKKTAIRNRLGSKLRSLAGPAKAPAKPAAPTKQPPPEPKAPPPPAPSTRQEPAPDEATMEEAWAEFCTHCPPEKWNQQAIEKEWFRILAELFPGKQPDELTPADWGVMLVEGPGKIIPF